MLTRAKVKSVGDAMSQAIAAKAVELGINVDKNCGGRYNTTTGEVTFKFTVTIPVEGALEAQMARNKEDAMLLGLNKNVGDSFKSWDEKVYKIASLNLNRPKYPVSVERADGKSFKMTVAQVNASKKID